MPETPRGTNPDNAASTRIIVDPRLPFARRLAVSPDEQRYTGRAKKVPPFQQKERVPTADSLGLAVSYLERLSPKDYEIQPDQATIAKSLTAISIETSGTARAPEYHAVYEYPEIKDLTARLARKNSAPEQDIQLLIGKTSIKVAASYRIAMAMAEHQGVLPTGSPNIEEFIRYLKDVALQAGAFNYQPYVNTSATGLLSVLNRQTSAILLTETSPMRLPRDYVQDLGAYLEAQ